MFYRSAIRPLLFQTDPERIHDCAIRAGEIVSRSSAICAAVRAAYARSYERLETEIAGLRLPNPVGLAAGFDKSGRAVPFWAALGFGHVEIGSISAEPSAGNAKPRLFRIPADNGIVVNYGLPNDGARRITERLEKIDRRVHLGINVVNTNHGPGAPPDSDDAIIDDYTASVRSLAPLASYLTLNLSCPNTCDGRNFVSDANRVRRLLEAVRCAQPAKPVFLKVAPFPDVRELDAFLQSVDGFEFVSGFSVNLPPGKPSGIRTPGSVLSGMPGAVSGRPCFPTALRAIRDLYVRVDHGRYKLIGSGGIFSAEDAYEMIRAGASMVQLLTAMVYEGPGIVGKICAGLNRLLARDGFRHVGDAVGARE